MKLIFLTMGLLLIATSVSAIDTQALPQDEKSRRRLNQIEKMGGIVEVERDGKKIEVCNLQKRVDASVIEETLKKMRSLTMLPFFRTDEAPGEEGLSGKAAKLLSGKTGAVIFIIDQPATETILVAPEQRWASVNVSALAENADAGRLAERTNKEIWRAAVILLASSNSMAQPCLMQPITSLSELDRISMTTTTPEPFAKMATTSKAYGINPVQRGLYYIACQEGWAPAPTNDVQRTIWNRVKADKERGPTNPIKIPPPKKK